MLNIHKITRALAVSAAVTGLILPAVAAAQDIPSYAVGPQPTVQQPIDQQQGDADETITGEIASVDGPFDIQVADSRGFGDNVQLHQGTVINPTGLTLAPGMNVTIQGYADGGVFQANEIDTPYQQYAGELPPPVYYGAGYWYPGFGYGYGPAFSLAFVFGDGWVRRPFGHAQAWNGRPWATNVWAAHPYAAGRGGYSRPEGFNRVSGFAGTTGYRGEAGAYRATTPTYRTPTSYAGTDRTYSAPARSYQAPARSYAGYQGATRSYAGYQGAARSTATYRAPAANRSYGGGGGAARGGEARTHH
jgi:hypothetical protein